MSNLQQQAIIRQWHEGHWSVSGSKCDTMPTLPKSAQQPAIALQQDRAHSSCLAEKWQSPMPRLLWRPKGRRAGAGGGGGGEVRWLDLLSVLTVTTGIMTPPRMHWHKRRVHSAEHAQSRMPEHLFYDDKGILCYKAAQQLDHCPFPPVPAPPPPPPRAPCHHH